ncbi:uncharacterized protein [Solanum tuberosum]|uniref:uncharacterized protein n=1 Tax=Solanum tuberosum TaxID=4113 RepID=UPI00073A0DC5|nr:PREDICTED: uncharacterized protein LOC107062669 [Solanum tuberosum]
MAIPTQNPYTNLDVQKSSAHLEELEIHNGSKQHSRLQPALNQQQEEGEQLRTIPKYSDNIAGKIVSKGQEVTGIDSMLSPLNPLKLLLLLRKLLEAWMGGNRGHLLTCREGCPNRGGELTHARHEELEFDHRGDSRAPVTPLRNQKIPDTQEIIDTHQQHNRFNNKSGERLNQQGKLLPDDFGELNSEDEVDPDNQSMDESEEDADDTMKQTGPVFGSNLHDKCSDVQRVTEEHGLSPRGRKQTRHIPHQSITSMSDNSCRLMTRSKSKDQSHIAIVKLQHQMDQAVSNPNGKIWLFWSNDITGQVLEKHDQHITVTFQHTALPNKFMMSFVYAKCKEYMRRPLWDRLLLYANMDFPWCTIGDFNVITSIEEKLGGIPYIMNKSLQFIGVIEACGLIDLGYTWLLFTWCNQRDAEARVWKRLDRSMANDKWLENLPQTTIENLSSVVQQCWDQVTTGNPMWKLHMKMKRLTSTLSKWFKQEYGDIFTKVREFEESIRKSEEEFMTNNTEAIRQKLHQMNATYITYLKLEEAILQQKTQLQWFQEGDANTKYFHALMRGRRKRLFLHKICIENEVWIQGEEQIAQNEMLQAIPNIDELRHVVFAMNPYSAAGPDGFGGKCYQVCWNIIKEDLLAVVQSFFCGHIMPKFMSRACLVLLPKIEHPSRLTELRPISLSNFTNKIISKVLNMRLATVLPLLLSDNQSRFVRGKSITESIMLAQEITNGIKKPEIGSNVVIKLDMAKAYDRVSWSFACLVLRRFGFGEMFIDLVWRIMGNNWYSIIINGLRKGFFHSTRGLKQGDHLSPALFILGA